MLYFIECIYESSVANINHHLCVAYTLLFVVAKSESVHCVQLYERAAGLCISTIHSPRLLPPPSSYEVALPPLNTSNRPLYALIRETIGSLRRPWKVI